MTRLHAPSGSIAFLIVFFIVVPGWSYSGPPIERFELIVFAEKGVIEVNIHGDVAIKDAELVELDDGKPLGKSKLSVDSASKTKTHLSGRIFSKHRKFREMRIILSRARRAHESVVKDELDFFLNCNYSPCKAIDWTEYAVRKGRAKLRKLPDGRRIVEENLSISEAKK